jgi:hypothetical protein
MKALSRSLLLAVPLSGFLLALKAQTPTSIPDTEAAQHVGRQAAVEGMMVKVLTSESSNTFLNFGAAYPNETFTGGNPK